MTAQPLPPDRTPSGWGRVAEAYDARVTPVFVQFAKDALRLTGLAAGERVLDVAAGTGALSIEAARRGARVLATDFAPEMIAQLEARARREKVDVETRVMDGQALAVDPASFDAAYSVFGLIFFPDRAAGFRGMRRALKPGGRCAVVAWSTPDRLDWFAAFGAAMKRTFPDHPPPPSPPAVFSLSDPGRLRREMEDAGFVDVRVETVRHPWIVPSLSEEWPTLTTTNPVVPAFLTGLSPGEVERLRVAVLEASARFARPDGAIEMWGEAHVATGRA